MFLDKPGDVSDPLREARDIPVEDRKLRHEHEQAQVELTHNWGEQGYDGGRNFGHLAYRVDNIYETCQRLIEAGVTINRPPRDGHMAFVRTPDNISIELLQDGHLEPAEPWPSVWRPAAPTWW